MTTYTHFPFLVPFEADALLAEVLNSLPLIQRPIRMFGRETPQPRLTAGVGADYRYSGVTVTGAPWTAGLDRVRAELSKAVGIEFNSCLANLYRDGQDMIGWHSDNEKDLATSTVAALHLGATRPFHLQTDGEVVALSKDHGFVTLFDGNDRHHVPRVRQTGRHLSLTFRQLHTEEKQCPTTP